MSSRHSWWIIRRHNALRGPWQGTYTEYRRTFKLGVDRYDRGEEEEEDGLELHIGSMVYVNSEVSLRDGGLRTS